MSCSLKSEWTEEGNSKQEQTNKYPLPTPHSNSRELELGCGVGDEVSEDRESLTVNRLKYFSTSARRKLTDGKLRGWFMLQTLVEQRLAGSPPRCAASRNSLGELLWGAFCGKGSLNASRWPKISFLSEGS